MKVKTKCVVLLIIKMSYSLITSWITFRKPRRITACVKNIKSSVISSETMRCCCVVLHRPWEKRHTRSSGKTAARTMMDRAKNNSPSPEINSGDTDEFIHFFNENLARINTKPKTLRIKVTWCSTRNRYWWTQTPENAQFPLRCILT